MRKQDALGLKGPLASEAIRREKEQNEIGKSLHAEEMSSDERKKLDRIMKDEELTSLLMDVDMQRVIQECTTVPMKMHWYMHHDEIGPKLRKMISAGLFKVA
mmetsp:Transcript_6150/g.9081  ORF Transcript_6150/g.9081 Transcript_6150/m.9081 type:complete len:102 (+) Transcript_6150:3-308(+)